MCASMVDEPAIVGSSEEGAGGPLGGTDTNVSGLTTLLSLSISLFAFLYLSLSLCLPVSLSLSLSL